jgi:plasmid stabilization system protein ParE
LQRSLTTFESEIRLLRSACVRAAIYESLQDLILFPYIGRLQQTKGVRKFVTHKYRYLVYYTIDEVADEIFILNVKHAAQRREHEEA